MLCAVFGSYRVWAKERTRAGIEIAQERAHANAQVAQKDSELTQLRGTVASLTQRKPRLKLTVSVEGLPPSQALKIVANRPVIISRVDYMLSMGVSIAGEDISKQGESLGIPINYKLLQQVWNTYRPDRNHNDHSGPAQIGITVAEAGGHPHQHILPIQMDAFFQGSTNYIKVTGSQVFYEPV